MKKIFLDTNFIIDYFVREDYHSNAEKIIRLRDTHRLEFHISYLTIANFAYIMRKMQYDRLRLIIEQICNSFIVISNTRNQILLNLQYFTTDFEDGLQYQAAISVGCECMITRNKKDFSFSRIPVYTPEEFLSINFS